MLKTVPGEKTSPTTISGDKIVLTDAKGGTATVTTADVFQSNGVIHVIDTVPCPTNLLLHCFQGASSGGASFIGPNKSQLRRPAFAVSLTTRYNQASHASHLSLRAVAYLSTRSGLRLLLQPGKPTSPHAFLAEGPHRRSKSSPLHHALRHRINPFRHKVSPA